MAREARLRILAAMITTKIYLARCTAKRRQCDVSDVIKEWFAGLKSMRH